MFQGIARSRPLTSGAKGRKLMAIFQREEREQKRSLEGKKTKQTVVETGTRREKMK
jgi:hypothetical protein